MEEVYKMISGVIISGIIIGSIIVVGIIGSRWEGSVEEGVRHPCACHCSWGGV